ncbi:MAG: extracellular solute-binding protein [Selenomonadaceae bacterium]|nr:extracellular solute-binding protein [Selenomonadaceae bacterium]
MRRFAIVFCVALVVAAIILFPYISISKESERPMREITALTTLPPSVVEILSDEYERTRKIRVHFVPLTKEEIFNNLENNTEASLVVADQETLRLSTSCFSPTITPQWDFVPEHLKDKDGLWTGIWYDPIVFCENLDYLKTHKIAPLSWQNLAATNNIRIGMTDFLAAEAMENLLFSMIAQYGDAAAYSIWRGIHSNVVSYAKFLNNPARQAGMGEVDIAVVVQSEAIRYLNDDYPLKIIYPRDGTSYMLVGTGIIRGKENVDEGTAREFADWLQTDEAHQILQKNGFYFIPANPATLTYKSFGGKELFLYTAPINFSKEQKHDFVDRWVKYIRLGGN